MIGVILALAAFANLPLATAETRAIARSPDVAIAAGRLHEEQALFAQARASYGPALTANYALAPQGVPQGTIAQRLTTVGAQVALGDLLAYSPLVAQANANVRAAQFDYANAVRTERVHLIGLYFSALSAHAILSAQQQALQAAIAQQHAAQMRFRAGDVPQVDVVRANVAVAQAQAILANAQAQQRTAYANLATEAGVPTSDLGSLENADPVAQGAVPTTASAAVEQIGRAHV